MKDSRHDRNGRLCIGDPVQPVPHTVDSRETFAVRMNNDLLPTLSLRLSHSSECVESAFHYLLPSVGEVRDHKFKQVKTEVACGDQRQRKQERFVLCGRFDQFFFLKMKRTRQFLERNVGKCLEYPARGSLVLYVSGKFELQCCALTNQTALTLFDSFETCMQGRTLSCCAETREESRC